MEQGEELGREQKMAEGRPRLAADEIEMPIPYQLRCERNGHSANAGAPRETFRRAGTNDEAAFRSRRRSQRAYLRGKAVPAQGCLQAERSA